MVEGGNKNEITNEELARAMAEKEAPIRDQIATARQLGLSEEMLTELGATANAEGERMAEIYHRVSKEADNLIFKGIKQGEVHINLYNPAGLFKSEDRNGRTVSVPDTRSDDEAQALADALNHRLMRVNLIPETDEFEVVPKIEGMKIQQRAVKEGDSQYVVVFPKRNG